MNRANTILILHHGWGRQEKEKSHSTNYANYIYSIFKDAGYKVFLKKCEKKIDILELESTKEIIIYNTLYGRYGEDGIIQAILEFKNISYTGSGITASSIAMNKFRCIRFIRNLDIKTPVTYLLDASVNELYSSIDIISQDQISYPIIVKPNSSSFSHHVYKINSDSELKDAIRQVKKYEEAVIIQEFINGKNIYVPVICGKAMTPIESEKNSKAKPILSKYGFQTKNKNYIIPARLSKPLENEIKGIAVEIHNQLGCRGLTRSDFIVNSKNEIYFLENNTQHSIRKESMASQSAKASSISEIKLLETILNDRWKRKII